MLEHFMRVFFNQKREEGVDVPEKFQYAGDVCLHEPGARSGRTDYNGTCMVTVSSLRSRFLSRCLSLT